MNTEGTMVNMTKAKAIVSLLLICCLVMWTVVVAGCGGDDNGEGEGAEIQTDTTAPTVQSTNPDDGATDVDIGAIIEATFSEAMKASTITESTFTVTSDEGAIGGDVEYVGSVVKDGVMYTSHKAVFTPSAGLEESTTYTATITTEVQDTSGNSMASDFSWSFSIPDMTPPAISVDVMVTDITPNTAKIAWETSEMATCTVEYGKSDKYGLEADSEAGLEKSHSVTLTGLSSSATYYLRIRVTDEAGNVAFSDGKDFETGEQWVVSNLVVSPTELLVYEEATASVEVTNVGNVRSTYTAWLDVGGNSVGPERVAINPGETVPVSFVFVVEDVPEDGPTLEVGIDGLYEQLTVSAWEGVPTRNIGETWTYETTVDEITYTMTVEVTDTDVDVDGKSCYVMSIANFPIELILGQLSESYTDDLQISVTSVWANIQKATGLPVSIEGVGTFTYAGISSQGTVSVNFSYEFPGEFPFPIEEGAESDVLVTVDIVFTVPSIESFEYEESMELDFTLVVEDVEDVEIGDQTYEQCLEVVIYDYPDRDPIIGTIWISDEVGMMFVNMILNADEASEYPPAELTLVSYDPGT